VKTVSPLRPTSPDGPKRPWRRKLRTACIVIIVLFIALLANLPVLVPAANAWVHQYKITRLAYEQKYGLWTRLNIPVNFRVNGIHSTVLVNGDILIMAGSGNDQTFFNAGTFKTLLLNPVTMQLHLIPTPWDAFCAGHIQLPDGNILVAGGTARYENLKPVYAGGAMTVYNNAVKPLHLPKGTIFVGPNLMQYKSAFALTVPAATTRMSADGTMTTAKGAQNVWVDALSKGKGSVAKNSVRYQVLGRPTLQAQGTAMTLAKQNFQGSNDAYIFNVHTLSFQEVNSMQYARWYPTLVEMGNGMVMTMSGLDSTGNVAGNAEWFNPTTNQWSPGPYHGFPTYPATFLTESGQLFFTGSNAGYGPNTPAWRSPGFWNPYTNAFKMTPGIPDATMLETSASVMLPPAQNQEIMVMGGGGVGQSNLSTSRTATIDLNAPDPHWVRGPNLLEPTRYPNAVILPNDTILVTGGSRYYRGMRGSDNHDTAVYNVATNSFTRLADAITGRDYHSEALLLPDGRVITIGGNPLFGDPNDTSPQTFNQEIDIYSPPYLFAHSLRPVIQAAPQVETLGKSYLVYTSQARKITTLRLLRPANVTHVTDVNQRSVAVPFTHLGDNALQINLPRQRNLLPPGWYMLFANIGGVPSHAYWIQIL
jgi:hypothetical protein